MSREAYLVNMMKVLNTLHDNAPDEQTGAYYHCVWDGNVHNSKNYDNVLFNIKQDLKIGYLPIELAEFNITSGICRPCLKNYNVDKSILERIIDTIKPKHKED